MRMGFTGTRRGMTAAQKASFRSLMENKKPWAFDHGLCQGADTEAHLIVREVLGEGGQVEIYGHPGPLGDWRQSVFLFEDCWHLAEHKPFLDRNHDIVNSVDVMVACPGESTEELRSGTWATIRYTLKRGKPLHLILPDGRVDFTAGKEPEGLLS